MDDGTKERLWGGRKPSNTTGFTQQTRLFFICARSPAPVKVLQISLQILLFRWPDSLAPDASL
jgi:hypothetical protein